MDKREDDCLNCRYFNAHYYKTKDGFRPLGMGACRFQSLILLGRGRNKIRLRKECERWESVAVNILEHNKHFQSYFKEILAKMEEISFFLEDDLRLLGKRE